VTIVERNESLIHREDPDVMEAIGALFRDERIEVHSDTTIRRAVGTSGELVRLDAVCDGAETMIEGTHLLAAAGRTPNTDGIGLEQAGIEIVDRGRVKVKDRLQTTVSGVWAVGDCAGSPYFTHVAYDDFRVVRDNIAGGNRSTTGRQVPFCLFTDPELARVGLSNRISII
jgi:pyruvate/2-oxoglutarate dehydrogenase complex dihydrolipoamide dehydrogenase (E3) component